MSRRSHTDKHQAPIDVRRDPGVPLSRRQWLGLATVGVVTAATLIALDPFARRRHAGLIPVTMYASRGCECCHHWVGHLEDQGFQVHTQFMTDVGRKKDALGVPASLRSCHTAEIDGYVVEGHVPAEVIKRFLAERPSDRGLAAPGMPGGSPGMENVPKQPFDVIAFNADGTTRVYARV